ncbi:oleate hydratase [Bradyrhizobium vignae]|uniref:oleate hydratase n=1 Tax=Bradyrhizobium vignae TaxID=1549949 RepID=UPI003D322750
MRSCRGTTSRSRRRSRWSAAASNGTQLANGAYSLRGGRMLTTDHYECTWDLLSSIPSLEHPGLSARRWSRSTWRTLRTPGHGHSP